MKIKALFVAVILNATLVVSASAAEREIYIPREFASYDLNDDGSPISFKRSRQTEHCVVFWEKGFGDDPNAESVPEEYRVDVDALLKAAERAYETNIEKLKFAAPGKSGLDRYKLEIVLRYRKDWLATGSGYDDVIGALWISPATCRPAGPVIAHELGHCFQYQVFCDQRLNNESALGESGFRYAPRDGLGNALWEQCAEWQSTLDYPEETFKWYYRDVWAKHCHRAFENEWKRYQSYWAFYAFSELRGYDVVAKIWQGSRAPEDFLAAYLRLQRDGDVERFNDDLYYYASRAATFDFKDVPEAPQDWLDAYRPKLYENESGAFQIAYESCPDISGFNVVPFDPEDFDGKIEIEFKALDFGAELAETDPGEVHKGADGTEIAGKVRNYNAPEDDVKNNRPDHRYGFVALRADGSRVYGEPSRGAEGRVSFEIPADATRVLFVVVGATTRYASHKWNHDESDDLQLPYEIKVIR